MGLAPALEAVYLAAILLKIHLAALAGKQPKALLLCAAAPPAAVVAAVRPPNLPVGVALGAAAAAILVSTAKLKERYIADEWRWLFKPHAALALSGLVSAFSVAGADVWSAVAAAAGWAAFVAMQLYRDHVLQS